ncbi:hypothetical protein GN244_ATG15908 [Phytophthora infestans]|uniref:Uncharacterized protein n=1 Tax=Phytophthora infestans TaxID=4787 RepID=A0A833S461_PHYIN|nr:hypothetical protein GN244_ATG15908 [Phytophthora infestans]KAF4131804.1 hypothetical protein GN958_ATG18998 [Phytophthora infestans]KAF4131819.1 hypothetical protein GN958_ATG19013 [Phytophthora infestans]
MLSFGAQKKFLGEWSEEELLEDEAFALLESILDGEHDEVHVIARSTGGTAEEDKTQDDMGHEKAFALLESILREDVCNKDGELLTADEQERGELKVEAFALLEMTLEDDDTPIEQDLLIHTLKHQSQGVDPMEMQRLEDAAFALLETILDDGDEPIDEDILFSPHEIHQHQTLELREEPYVPLDSIVQGGNGLKRIDFTFRSIYM